MDRHLLLSESSRPMRLLLPVLLLPVACSGHKAAKYDPAADIPAAVVCHSGAPSTSSARA